MAQTTTRTLERADRCGLFRGRPVAVAAAAVLILAGCKTLPIKTSDSLSLSSQLSRTQTREAVLTALGAYAPADAPTTATTSPVAVLPEKSFTVGLTYYRRGDGAPRNDWYAEAADESSVTAAYQRGHFYLKVRVLLGPGEMRFEILDAENLKFTGSHIHKRAYVLIDQLKSKIRRAAGQLSVMG